MASFQKRSKGWRVQVRLKGQPELSATFRTKAEAAAWAAERESELRQGNTTKRTPKTILDALQRFARDESPKRRGEKWETVRLKRYETDLPFAGLLIRDVTPDHLAKYRDARLQAGLATASVRRDMALISAVFEVARLEWGWIDRNPLRDVKKPANSKPRTRLITDDERDRMVLALGYQGGRPVEQRHFVALALLFALETAMRSSEILSLTEGSILGPVAELTKTKNGDDRRVPLSKRAVEILSLLPRTKEHLFPVSGQVRDQLFRRARDSAGIKGLTFHDSRATALTRLAKLPGMDVMRLAKISGHRDIKTLAAVYFRESAEDIAKLLG